MNGKIELVDRVTMLKDSAAGKKVLHLGCTNWPYTMESVESGTLLHLELGRICSDLYGFDFDEQGIEVLRRNGCPNLFRADLEKLDEVEIDEKFDVVIAGEMIEHLNNPGLFLSGIKRFMAPESTLVITTINAYSAMRFAMYGLRGKGGVNEPVHPDHVAYYSYRTLRLLIERHGFDVARFHFYDIGPEHRPHLPWYYRLVNDVSMYFSPQLSDGVIAICRLRHGTE